MSVAGAPIRSRVRVPRRTLIPTPTITALGPRMSPELSINIPPSLRPSQYRSFGHLTPTLCVPRRSSAFAAPTATARLKPPSAPAPRGKRHRMENTRLPPTAKTQGPAEALAGVKPAVSQHAKEREGGCAHAQNREKNRTDTSIGGACAPEAPEIREKVTKARFSIVPQRVR